MALRWIAVIATACALAQPASAESLESTRWAGWYAEIVGGGMNGQSAQTNTISGVSNGHFGQTGGTVGGTLGFNLQKSGWLLGVETDLSWADLEGDEKNCGRTRDHVCTTTMRAFGTARVRAGIAVSPVSILYVTGGLAGANIRATRDTGATVATDWIGGWTAGGGLEAEVASRVSLKIEYLYADFEGASTTYTVLPSTPVRADERHVQILRLGTNIHF